MSKMDQPTTGDLRTNFQDQLKTITEKVNSLTAELKQADEFRLKIIGGLETLQILDPVSAEELASQNAEGDNK